MKKFFAIILISFIFTSCVLILTTQTVRAEDQWICKCDSGDTQTFTISTACNIECVNWCIRTQNSSVKECKYKNTDTTIPPQDNVSIPPQETITIPPKDNGNKQTADLDNPIGVSCISGETCVSEVIGKIIQIFLGIIGTISLIMFIYGGFMMLTSAGRAGQIKTGQQTLVWASIGILIVFTSYAVLKFVFSAFGI